MASIAAAKKAFFKADHFAVVGASKDQAKIGNKVLRWYKDRGLDVVPVHPKEPSVEDIKTVASVSELAKPQATSISIITPPAVSLGVVKTALQDLNVTGVWLQPGAENAELVDFVNSLSSEQKDKVILGGPCILVEGQSLAQASGKL